MCQASSRVPYVNFHVKLAGFADFFHTGNRRGELSTQPNVRILTFFFTHIV